MLYRFLAVNAAVCVLATLTACAQSPASPSSGSTPTLEENPELVQRYAETITASDLAAHLYVFASDYFEGRETGTRGQKLAATYLAGQYRKLGLEPKGTAQPSDLYSPEAYFQPFTLTSSQVQRATLSAAVDGENVFRSTYTPDAQDDLAFLAAGRPENAEGGVLFAGYGITERDFDELAAAVDAGLDATGKWVLLFDGEPLDRDGRSLLTDDGTPTDNLDRWYTKFVRFYRSGIGSPVGFLIVSDASPLQQLSFRDQAAARAEEVGNLALIENAPKASQFPPVFHISTKAANALLRTSGRTVSELQRAIHSSLTPIVFDVAGATVQSTARVGPREVSTENVLAYVEGSDLKDEVVVISSHYDHLGMNPAAPGDDGIYNGADDDGSGTVTTLELAEAFMTAKRDGVGPRRSVLFLNFTGEEKGLLGSEYYADHEPVIPLDATVTNLNIDMIGRHDPEHAGDEDYIYVIGSRVVSEDLDRISTRANDLIESGLELDHLYNTPDDPNRYFARSDHWNFGKHRVPFIFYFDGGHAQYHGVDDEADRIDYDQMARVGRLIFATAWQVANQDARPEISGRGFWDDEG